MTISSGIIIYICSQADGDPFKLLTFTAMMEHSLSIETSLLSLMISQNSSAPTPQNLQQSRLQPTRNPLTLIFDLMHFSLTSLITIRQILCSQFGAYWRQDGRLLEWKALAIEELVVFLGFFHLVWVVGGHRFLNTSSILGYVCVSIIVTGGESMEIISIAVDFVGRIGEGVLKCCAQNKVSNRFRR